MKRVLIAEDYEDARLLYATWLRQAGFLVAEAADGEQAVAEAESSCPDVIIIDLHMPHMDGWEAIRAIRKRLGSQPYIVAFSAHFGGSARREAGEAGCDEFIAKPLEPSALIAVVEAALRARSSP